MSTKFKVGDRVKVYANSCWHIGMVTHVIDDKWVRVDFSNMYYYFQQCRRLKPKVKKVPREVWLIERQEFKPIISEGLYGSIIQEWSVVPKGFQGAVLFREVIKK
jgi:hypothetical protein